MSHLYSFFSLLLITIIVFQPISFASGQPLFTGWQATGQTGGPVQGLAVQGNYAYMGYGLSLSVIDISNPASMREVGKTRPFSDFVRGVAVQASLAFVADGSAGLRIVDISDPTAPIEVGFWDSPGDAQAAAISGTVVYLADGPMGLHILDVTNPQHPLLLKTIYPADSVLDVVINKSSLFLAAAGGGLLVADVSTPSLPVEVSRLDTPGYAYSVASNGQYVFVADGWEGLQVVDVNDPEHPLLVASAPSQAFARGITLSGHLALVSQAYQGISVVNLVDPLHPSQVGFYPIQNGNIDQSAVIGSTAFFTDRYAGLRAFNLAQPTVPTLAGQYATIGLVDGVAVSNGYAYLAAGKYGLGIVNISNLQTPKVIGLAPINNITDNYATAVAVQGNYAFLCDISKLYVADVTSPTDPKWVAEVSTGGLCRGMDVSGPIVYIANEWGLQIIQLAAPVHPVVLSYLPFKDPITTPDGPTPVNVKVNGNYAYVTLEQNGLAVVDVSDPLKPKKIGWVTPTNNGFFRGVAAAGSLVYVTDKNMGLRIINASNPVAPYEMSNLVLPGESENIQLVGNQAYIAAGSQGMWVIDISDPLNPIVQSGYKTNGNTNDLVVSSGSVFAADMAGGLLIISPTSSSNGNSSSRNPNENRFESPTTLFNSGHAPISAPSPDDFVLADNLSGLPAIGSKIQSSSCVVTTTADSGPGSLRACLTNTIPGLVITFNQSVFSAAHPAEIKLLSGLGVNVDSVTIDASQAGVVLDGSLISEFTFAGLNLLSSGNIIRGLQITNFPGNGIGISGANNLVGGDRSLGIGPSGRGNVINNNKGMGIGILGVQSIGNRIVGNIIGLDASGQTAAPNGIHGVALANGAQDNIVGGSLPADRNIISGNRLEGVSIQTGAHNNSILGNFVGTDSAGQAAIGNIHSGIAIEVGGFGNLIQGNLLSGNGVGILLYDWGTNYNTVVGNRVGTDASGTRLIFNNSAIKIGGSAANNRIGGTRPEDRNLICGIYEGVSVWGPWTEGNLILGNWIGLDATGTQALGGFYTDIILGAGSRSIIGGSTPQESNHLASLITLGIYIQSSQNWVLGNKIGFDTPGQAPDRGILLQLGGRNLVLGNTIANTHSAAIQVDGSQRNTLRRNLIYNNSGKGFSLVNNGNGSLNAPAVTPGAYGFSGTTCPGCVVEWFMDSADQGRIFQGFLIANAQGQFQETKVCPFVYLNLTATATDGEGNTSPFSVPQEIPWDCTTPNPVPALVSLDPITITANRPTFLLTATGVGFIPNSRIRWNSIDLSTTFISDTQLAAVVPSGLITLMTKSEDINITVFTPEPGGGTSAALIFEIKSFKTFIPNVSRGSPGP